MAAGRSEDPKHEANNAGGGEEGEIEEDVQAQKVAQRSVRQKVSQKRPIDGGGVYLPPAKRRLLQQQQEAEAPKGDQALEEDQATNLQAQRDSWQSQKRVIHGTINRLNAGTIKPLIQDLFQKVNLVRLRGVLCKSVLLATVSSPKYSDVYAALISVVNSKLPEIGELAVKRSILAFRRHYKRREKSSCQAICIFLAHLFHQGVVHELVILQILSVLLDGDPTDDSVEVAVQLLQVSGQALLEVSPAGVRACLERLRSLLHEGQLNKRVEYKMEQLLKMRKNGFRGFPPISEDLDLVERDDQITFEITLDDDEIRKEEELDVFQVDPDFKESESEWAQIRTEILGGGDDSSDDGDDSDDDDDDDDDEDDSSSDGSAAEDQELAVVADTSKELTVVQDLTEADLIHLRRTIYLTIMSSATFEECTHKLARIDIPPGREAELINMLIECCSQERTFLRYYGLISARFCLLDDRWRDAFMQAFEEQYTTIHRLETNKLRNVAKMFAHLLHTDSIPWSVLSIIHLNEDETTSSSRIFIKIVIQEIAEAIGIAKLKNRFETKEEEPATWFAGMFPKDNVRNTRYAINFFTSIGLGPLTDDLREFLKNAPKLILAKAKEMALAKKSNDSDSSSVSSTSSSSSSSSSSSGSNSSYSSSSSYSSRSSSRSRSDSGDSASYSSSSYSSRRGRKGRRYSRSRSRSRSFSSSSSSRSYSSESSDSRESSKNRRGRDRNSRRGRRSRSMSPPKEVFKKDENTTGAPTSETNQQRKSPTEKRNRSRDTLERSNSNERKGSRRDLTPKERHSDAKKNTRNKNRRRDTSRSPDDDRRRHSSRRSRSGSSERQSERRSRKRDDREKRTDGKEGRKTGSRQSDSRDGNEPERSRARNERSGGSVDRKEHKLDEAGREPSSKNRKRARSRSPSSGSETSNDSRKYRGSRRDRERGKNRKTGTDKPRSRSNRSLSSERGDIRKNQRDRSRSPSPRENKRSHNEKSRSGSVSPERDAKKKDAAPIW